MQKSVMEVQKFCAFSAASSQAICHSPIRDPSVTDNEVFPFCLTFHRSRAFGREKLLVNHPVSFVELTRVLRKSLGLPVSRGSLGKCAF